MMQLIERQLARAQAQLATLERMFEDKARELYLAKQAAEDARERVDELLEVMVGALWILDKELVIRRVNTAASQMLQCDRDALVGRDFTDCVVAEDRAVIASALADGLRLERSEVRMTIRDRSAVWTLLTASRFAAKQGGDTIVLVGLDITERKHMEARLMQAQKLESIGQLAAGVAHEINTPSQFVADNLSFLRDSFADLMSVVDAAHEGGRDNPDLPNALEAADIEYLRDEVPAALEQSGNGMSRIRTIVASMKAFSHPDAEARAPVDVNAVVRDTIEVSRNEWKYTAKLSVDLDDQLDHPLGHAGEIAQVTLNLIVNAAQALANTEQGRRGDGSIRVWTRNTGEAVEIGVSDDGGGIPHEIRSRIFDPFFTTKPVGQGSGQGLSIVHNVVTVRHEGSVDVESEPGSGTTIRVRLPVAA